MASTPPFSNRYQARASSSKQPVARQSTSNDALASVDVVYRVVWMASKASSTRPQKPSDDTLRALASPRPSIPQGSIRISGPATDDSIWKADEPPPAQLQTPSSKDYRSLYDLSLQHFSEASFTGPAADDDYWRRGEGLSDRHERSFSFTDYGSPYATISPSISGPADDDSGWRRGEVSSAQQQGPLIDYESPYAPSSPRNSGSAAGDGGWRRDEALSAQQQGPLIDYSPGSPRITDSVFNGHIRMGGEPPHSWPQTPSLYALESAYNLPPRITGRVGITDSAVNNNTSVAGEPSSSQSQRRSIVREFPYDSPPRSLGNVRMTGPAADGSNLSKFQSQNDAPSAPIPQPTPEGKIPCVAKLQLDTLGALSTCSYDRATDSFSNFSVNDTAWGLRKGYRDYGDVQISTKKWSKGSWVSVKDDSGNEFLFVTVDRDHGLVRSWRPNLVAKRVIGGVGEKVGLTNEEFLRLGCGDDDHF